MPPARTRFAPSPTGYLHIGGVRTALFNWLVARQSGGQFVLRVDDTDLGRNKPEAVQPILDGFQWLGLDWDEGPTADGAGSVGPFAPYFQSQRNDSYVAAAVKLIAEGKAYPDYLTKDEQTADRVDKHLATFLAANPGASDGQIAKERDAAGKGQRPYTFRGKLRDADPAANLATYRANPGPVRFKVPTGRTVTVTDLIPGADARRRPGGPRRGRFQYRRHRRPGHPPRPRPGRRGVPAAVQLRHRRRRNRTWRDARHPGGRTLLEHAGPSPVLRGAGGGAAGVRARPGRQRAELERETVEAEDGPVHDGGCRQETPRRPGSPGGLDRRPGEGPRGAEPGHRRVLPGVGLFAVGRW